nr:hypothetical protein GCM10010200_076130 [Actinomadura rugatobispora]
MTSFPKWSDVRAEVVAGAGGEEGVARARQRNQAYIDEHRLAERRKSLGLSRDRMGVTKSRVSQIERLLRGGPGRTDPDLGRVR